MNIPETIDRVLELSKADDCIVIAENSSTANVRWANNTSTTNGATESATLVIVSIIDNAVGVITRNYFPEDSLEDLVRESEAAAAGKPQAEDALPLLPGDGTPADWNAPAEPTSIGVFAETAPRLADMFQRAASEDLVTFGYADHQSETVWLATSTGRRRRDTKVQGKIEFTAKSSDFSRSAWVGAGTRTYADVDVESMYRRATERLEWSKKTIAQPAGHYQVLLQPSAVADMALYAAFVGARRDADEGHTVYSKPGGGNKIGEKLFADNVTIYSDPYEPGVEVIPFQLSIGSSSYDSVFDNGMDVTRTDWVRDGVLSNLITTRHWAKKVGAPDAVPFGGNLLFGDVGGPTLETMISTTERALLVTCFWYIRMVDPQTALLTGLTRDGVFLVEDGEVKGAVNNFRYNMSPVHMFANTVEVGQVEFALPREFDEFGLTRMPPIRVNDFHMSSVSEAT
jgi:predicted Zn-dependent protease